MLGYNGDLSVIRHGFRPPLELAMSDILFLRGAYLLCVPSQGLQQRLQALLPETVITSANYWHIVKLKAPLAGDGRGRLSALLEEQPKEAVETELRSQACSS